MSKGTKEKILDAALELFSENGYAGTNIQGIADSVGIVKSALYRHFKSKAEIWNAVQDTMTEYYTARFGSADKLPQIPRNTEELFCMTMRMVDFTIHDKKVIMMRRILLTEQFRDERARSLASRFFIFDKEDIFEKVFSEMMKNGSLKHNDAKILAFSYIAPITALVHLCDREPDMINPSLEKLRSFLRHFIAEYGAEQ